jgi:hypothetical protein
MPTRRSLIVAMLLLLPLAATAQNIPKQKGPARTIGLFDFMCLKQLPELELIERAAGFGEFDQLIGEDLEPYKPAVAAEKIFAWRYHDHGERYILVAQRGKAQSADVPDAPDFTGATKTSCSLLVPSESPDRLLGELTRLIGRAPDKNIQDGGTHIYGWVQKSAAVASYITYYTPEKAGERAGLTATLVIK